MTVYVVGVWAVLELFGVGVVGVGDAAAEGDS
jgi:hypothetical protein